MIKTLFLLGIAALTLIPTWAFLLIEHFLNPVSFWQKALVAGIGIWILGGAQIVFLIIGACFVVAVLDD